MKGMILAAGFATRLRPLSEERPKVLFPLLGDTLLDRIEALFLDHGIQDTLINAHHLRPLLEEEIRRRQAERRMAYTLSAEAEILGTAGGIKQMMALAPQEDTFLVANGDIVCRGDLRPLFAWHRREKPLATLALLPWDGREKRGLVTFDEQNWVRSIPREIPDRLLHQRGGIFTGLYLLSRRIYPYLPPHIPSCIVREVFEPLLHAGGRIGAVVLPLEWAELGLLPSYFSFCQSLLPAEGRYLGPDCRVADGAWLGPGTILHRGCQVESGAKISRGIAWPGVRIDRDEVLEEAIWTVKHRVSLKKIKENGECPQP